MRNMTIWKQALFKPGLILLITILSACSSNIPVKDMPITVDQGIQNIRPAEKWCEEGIELLEAQKYEQAIALFDRALEIEPDYYQCWHNKSIALATLNKNEAALAANRKAIELMSRKGQEDQNSEIWSAKGLLLDMSLDYEQALDAYNNALEINPASLKDWFLKASLLKKMDRYDEALGVYNQAIKVEPALNWFWIGKGDMLLKLERYDEALSAYEQAIQLDEKQYFAWKGKSDALRALGRNEEADKILIRARAL